MKTDRDILIKALETAVPLYKKKVAGLTILGTPPPDREDLDPISTAIKSCAAYQAVSGQVLFSANSGAVLDAPTLAAPLFYRAEANVQNAAEWLIKLLTTRHARGFYKAALWGLSVDKETRISKAEKLIPFNALPTSRMKERILERAKTNWDKSPWLTQTYFDVPASALIIDVPEFPYIRKDNAGFLKIAALEERTRELATLLESVAVGHPIAIGCWFEYEDPDLDLNSWENMLNWNLPEVHPRIRESTSVTSDVICEILNQYDVLPSDMRSDLIRSMSRFTLSQCRHQTIDRILDMTLAFEIAVSGDSDSAAPSWKVSVRSAQLIGGELSTRLKHRRQIADLYKLRNKGTHGSSLKGIGDKEQKSVLEDASNIYLLLIRSFFKLGKRPDWLSLELEPVLDARPKETDG